MEEEIKKDELEVQTPPQGQEPQETAEIPQAKSAIQEAREEREKLQAENDRRERIIKREEDMYARNLLSGKTDAGDIKLTPEQVQKKQAESMASEMVSAFKSK